jgi:signal transduction histidine kinase
VDDNAFTQRRRAQGLIFDLFEALPPLANVHFLVANIAPSPRWASGCGNSVSDSKPDFEVSKHVAAAQLRLIVKGAQLAAILAPFWATFVSALLYSNFIPELGAISIGTLIVDVGLMSAWSVCVGILGYNTVRYKDLESNVASWSAIVWTVLLAGDLIWAGCLAQIWIPGNTVNHLFVASIFYATALALIACYASRWDIYASLQTIVTVVLIGLATIGDHSRIDTLIAVTALAFLLTSLYCGWLIYRRTYDELVQRLRAQALATDLRAARDALIDANGAKSAFLANMSHELRTPLNAIIGFSDMIKVQLYGPIGSVRYVEYAGDIFNSGHHLLSLVNDILDLSKIEAGKVEIEAQDVACAAAIDEAVRLTKVQANARMQSVVIVIEPACPFTLADPRALTQILVNLLSNAIKFTPHGGRVTVSARQTDGEVEYAISDTGKGIPAEDQERIFSAFEQLNNAYTSCEGGTGLGLALVKQLAKLQGGSVGIESTLDVGTTIWVRLPCGGSRNEEPLKAFASAS